MSNPLPPPAPAAHPRQGRIAASLTTLLDLLLPQDCALCGQASGRDAVCPGCREELPAHGEACCPRCGDLSQTGEVCGHCLRQPPHFDATFAAFAYGFPVDRLVQRFKYGGQLDLARWWAARLADALPPGRFDLIVPMPLNPTRLRQRGFNQALEIGRPLARRLDVRLAVDACVRTRATPPQAELERDQRLKNVRGAFECRRDLDGLRVLLIDDVMTTGASLNELARIVRLHGAAAVTAAAAVRTLHR